MSVCILLAISCRSPRATHAWTHTHTHTGTIVVRPSSVFAVCVARCSQWACRRSAPRRTRPELRVRRAALPIVEASAGLASSSAPRRVAPRGSTAGSAMSLTSSTTLGGRAKAGGTSSASSTRRTSTGSPSSSPRRPSASETPVATRSRGCRGSPCESLSFAGERCQAVPPLDRMRQSCSSRRQRLWVRVTSCRAHTLETWAGASAQQHQYPSD